MGGAVSSAPAVLFLFGEHAVVYDEPGLLCAIEKRTKVKTTLSEENSIKSSVGDLSYVEKSIEKTKEKINTNKPVSLTVESEIPVGAGLGSSAAVTVATIDSVSRALGEKFEKKQVAELAYQVEKDIQEDASRSQTFTSSIGGAVRIKNDEIKHVTLQKNPEIIVGYDGGNSPTGKMVADVAELKNSINQLDKIIDSIGDICLEGVKSIEKGDLKRVGKLMNINHGLLGAIGVSSSSLDDLVWTARDSGALGAKLTGAGGSGCIVVLCKNNCKNIELSLDEKADEVFRGKMSEGLKRLK